MGHERFTFPCRECRHPSRLAVQLMFEERREITVLNTPNMHVTRPRIGLDHPLPPSFFRRGLSVAPIEREGTPPAREDRERARCSGKSSRDPTKMRTAKEANTNAE